MPESDQISAKVSPRDALDDHVRTNEVIGWKNLGTFCLAYRKVSESIATDFFIPSRVKKQELRKKWGQAQSPCYSPAFR